MTWREQDDLSAAADMAPQLPFPDEDGRASASADDGVSDSKPQRESAARRAAPTRRRTGGRRPAADDRDRERERPSEPRSAAAATREAPSQLDDFNGPGPMPEAHSANGVDMRRRPYDQQPQQQQYQQQRPAHMDSVAVLPEEERTTSIPELEAQTRELLAELGNRLNIPNAAYLRKDDLIHRIVQAHGERGGIVMTSGILEITNDGYGFLRHRNLHHNINDVYVSQSQIRRFGLRTGDFVTGQIRSPKSGEKYYGLLRVDTVNGQDPETARMRPPFDQLTAVFPDRLFNLETDQKSLSTRLLNLIAPVGKGQRALIVSPPKAGKTILLHQIADALATNYPDAHILAALIGERPEEVTDWERTVKGAEVVSSTFDEPVEEHTRVAEIVLERAKRLVEAGRDVVILLDSITRLTRAYNIAAPSSGRTLSGGIDPVALYPPKRFFGAARNTEEAGTLTIIATCLVDTGSRMDDVIYEEFKGTGNMEVHLDRKLSERRIYPAIDILRSGTRREERLYDEQTYKGIVTLRRMLSMLTASSMDSSEATERILDRLYKTKNNAEFLATLTKDI
jgi:transcription termination factor Rho